MREKWFCPGIEPDFAYRCTGNCMVPTFYPGELVFIHQQEDFESGDIIAVEVDGWRMLKRAYKVPGGVRFVPDNPYYKPFQCSAEAVKVIGLAVARGVEKRLHGCKQVAQPG